MEACTLVRHSVHASSRLAIYGRLWFQFQFVRGQHCDSYGDRHLRCDNPLDASSTHHSLRIHKVVMGHTVWCSLSNSSNRIQGEQLMMLLKSLNWSLRAITLTSSLLSVSVLIAQDSSQEPQSNQWSIAGQNLSNTWSQPAEHSISPA